MGLMSELRRRNVLRMAGLYVVSAWLVMQIAEVLVGLGAVPEWIGRAVLGVLALGFPIALIFAWVYEITPEGLKRESEVNRAESITHLTGRRMDFIVIAVLAAAVLVFAYDKWWGDEPPEKSVAVLAFENMSGDPAQEYFADGISEEILNLLAQTPGLTVISRSSAFSFKGKNTPIPEVARQLNVAHVLEGSVRRVGNQVRITAQLIEASSDSHMWSQSYDRTLDDVFIVQDEIAEAISRVLKVKLAGVAGGKSMPSPPATSSPEAYDAYLKGRQLIHERTSEALQEAIGLLELSISLDSSFAPAHAHLAIATLLHRGYSNVEGRHIAALHLERAQALKPDLAETHAGRALYSLHDDPESAVVYAERALELNPSYVDAMHWLAIALYAVGRVEESRALHEREIVIDPLSIVARRTYATDLMYRGQTGEAHEIADRIVAQSPTAGYSLHARIAFWGEGDLANAVSWGLRASRNNFHAWAALGNVGEYAEAARLGGAGDYWFLATKGEWDEAVRVARGTLQARPNSAIANSDVAEVLYRAGRFEEALALYERALELSPEGRPILAWGPYYMIQLAVTRRRTGDEQGAREAAEMIRQLVAENSAEGSHQEYDLNLAMLAAFDHDAAGAIAALRSAVLRGLTWKVILDDPVFDYLQENPEFIALRQELDEILAREREKILQLICFDNPVPDEWQPLPETCEGVVAQTAL